MPSIGFYPKSENIGQMCISALKLESGGQLLPVMKKNLSRNSFNLENPPFHQSTKNMLDSYTFVLSRIKIKSLDLTINKREKNLCIPYTARKKIISYQKKKKKKKKKTAFWPKMRNSQQVCIQKYRNDKFRSNQKLNLILLHTLSSVKSWHLSQKYWKFAFLT